jgi:phosphoglycerate kinase
MSIILPHFLEALSLKDKTALVRFDYNLPLNEGRVLDDSRLRASLPTITFLRKRGAKVLILSHLGRPSGHDLKYSLAFIAPLLEALIHEPVLFSSSLDHTQVMDQWNQHPQAGVMILENIRFPQEEEKNDPAFCQRLAHLGDLYINDAFSVSHRAHASVEGITHHLPSYAGLHLYKEVATLGGCLKTPARPLLGILGGSKISSKFKVIQHLMTRLDHLFLGGAMAHTFLYAQGYDVGASLIEKDYASQALELLAHSKDTGCTLHIPQDLWGASTLTGPPQLYAATHIPPVFQGYDIGPASLKHLQSLIEHSKTVIWNGPLGVFEHPPYGASSQKTARMIADRTRTHGLFSVAGGGETVALLNQGSVTQDFSYVSTAGGAFLEFMEGRSLPGVHALKLSLPS